MARHKSRSVLEDRQRVLVAFFMTAGKLKLFDLKRVNAKGIWRMLQWMAGKYEP